MEEKICPVCGEENNCGLDETCWCMDYELPSILFYLTDDRSSCICRNCIEDFTGKGRDFRMLEDIFTRRSVRKFTGEAIDERDLKLILKAGFQAPSAHNKEPREYMVIRNREKLAELMEVHKYAKMLDRAGLAIVVCGDRDKQERLGYLVADCSASIENMLLAAHGLGLGGVWTGIHPIESLEEDFRRILGLRDSLLPVGMVVVGRPEGEVEPIDRYDESRISYID